MTTTHDLVVATATSPLFHRLAAVLPQHYGWGRPRHHESDLVTLVYGAARRQFRSYRRLDPEFAQQWPAFRAACLERGIDLGPVPPRYSHWEGARDRVLSRLPDFARTFTEGSLELANDLGLLHGEAGSIGRPDRSQVVYGDGTHLKGKFKRHLGEWDDTELGPCLAEFDLSGGATTPARLLKRDGGRWVAYHPETRKKIGYARIDEDAHVHDKYLELVDRSSTRARRARGHGLVMWHVRGEAAHTRITLALGLESGNGEADAALRLLLELKALAGDGVRGFAYDMAMRGTHLEQAMHAGLLPFVKVPAAATDGDDRVPFEEPIGVVAHKGGAHAGCRHEIVAVDGAVTECTLDGQGELVLAHGGRPLDVTQVKRTQRRDGRYSYSVGFRIRCHRESFVHWMTFPAATQGRRHRLKLNLDKVRPYHREHEIFRALYTVRNDAEAANAEYKKHLLDTRASQVSADRNLLDAILFFAGQNALNAHRHASGRARAA